MSSGIGMVGVVGAGAMGAGIAQVAALHGHAVVLADALPASVQRARLGHQAAMARDVEKGRRTSQQADAVLARISYVDGVTPEQLAAFAPCGMVIEAIIEQLAAKQQLLRALEAIVPSTTILASNTSSLSIAALAGACVRSERVVGVHFFSPAPVMPLVEIGPGMGFTISRLRFGQVGKSGGQARQWAVGCSRCVHLPVCTKPLVCKNGNQNSSKKAMAEKDSANGRW